VWVSQSRAFLWAHNSYREKRMNITIDIDGYKNISGYYGVENRSGFMLGVFWVGFWYWFGSCGCFEDFL